jgi:DNA-binding MarR family transcriptional regulator
VVDLLADELLRDLNGVRRELRRRLRDTLAVPELTPSQNELLRVVEDAPGIGVAAAARIMHLAGNSVSTLVNQLTDTGYLTRQTDPQDRRAARLHLTPAAAKRLSTRRAARAGVLAGGLAGLSSTDREALRRALPVLRRLSEILAEEGS